MTGPWSLRLESEGVRFLEMWGSRGQRGFFSTPSTWEPSGQVLYASSLACPGMPFLPGIREPSQQEDCGEIRHRCLLCQAAILRYKYTAHAIYVPEKPVSQSLIHTDEWPNPSVTQVVQAKE